MKLQMQMQERDDNVVRDANTQNRDKVNSAAIENLE